MKKDIKRFLVHGALFALLLIILCLLFNNLYMTLIFDHKQIYRTEQLYHEHITTLNPREIDFGFFGSSHTANGINPAFIPGAYNFGLVGENYVMTYYKLQNIVETDQVEIKTIVLPIDLETFGLSSREMAVSQNQLYFYAKDIPFNELGRISGSSSYEVWLRSRLLFLGNGEDIRFLVERPKATELLLGWNKNYGNFSRIDKRRSAEQDYILVFKGKPRMNNVTLEYFVKTLEFAKQHNMRVYLAKYPMTREYLETVQAHQLEQTEYYETIFENVESVLGDQYTVLDYTELFPEKSEYFSDPEHLNFAGAEILSRQVFSDLTKNSTIET